MNIWIDKCLQRDDAEVIKQLETLVAADQPQYIALICQGVVSWFSGSFDQALSKLEQAITLEPERWDVHFWKGMAYASVEQDEEAAKEVKQALTLGLPPVLLAPLSWFAQTRQEFYEKYALLLLNSVPTER